MAEPKIWTPGVLAPGRPAYVALADAIAADVAGRRLAPGDRLPTHRALARALRVTVGTVARGYAEAERRGLVSGEVGRGTFVRAGFGVGTPSPGLLDLASLHPAITGAVDPTRLLSETLRELAADSTAVRSVLATDRSADAAEHRHAAATWVGHRSFVPDPDQVVLTAGAQHALTVALLALVPAGAAVATTRLTNPGLVAAARTLGVRLVTVDGDDDGMHPEALTEACSAGAVAAVHLQPTLDNPTARTMPAARRVELAEAADRHGLWVLEEDPLAPLVPDRPDPLAALVPARTVHLASASKVLALGLRVGVLIAPEAAHPRLAAALRASTWLAAPLLAEILMRWVHDGSADRIVTARTDATRQRNELARRVLEPLEVTADPAAPHLWLPLPEPWSTGSFVAAARDAGLLVAPGDDFTVDRDHRAHGVRIGLNAELPDRALSDALATISRLATTGPRPEALT